MSTDATSPSSATANDSHLAPASPVPAGKGKGKHVPEAEDALMQDEEEDDDEEDEDEDEDDEEGDDEMEDQDQVEAIDPGLILSGGRRTRGVVVDYTSAEALARAGLKPGEEEDDEEASFVN